MGNFLSDFIGGFMGGFIEGLIFFFVCYVVLPLILRSLGVSQNNIQAITSVAFVIWLLIFLFR